MNDSKEKLCLEPEIVRMQKSVPALKSYCAYTSVNLCFL